MALCIATDPEPCRHEEPFSDMSALLGSQITDLQRAFSDATSDPESLRVAQQLGQDVMDCLVSKQAERAGVPASQLFPAYSFLRQSAAR